MRPRRAPAPRGVGRRRRRRVRIPHHFMEFHR
ncbi:hypothetical protein BPC006_II1408 [Burkholderia pseudomallei BPC006]|nr:hypothetical protein BPC006_II1408 [Burkholderia pseudomallei BPC006]